MSFYTNICTSRKIGVICFSEQIEIALNNFCTRATRVKFAANFLGMFRCVHLDAQICKTICKYSFHVVVLF